MSTTTFKISGLHCASCKDLIEDVAREISDVQTATLDIQTSILTIEHGDGFRPEPLIQKIIGLGAGYTVKKL